MVLKELFVSSNLSDREDAAWVAKKIPNATVFKELVHIVRVFPLEDGSREHRRDQNSHVFTKPLVADLTLKVLNSSFNLGDVLILVYHLFILGQSLVSK